MVCQEYVHEYVYARSKKGFKICEIASVEIVENYSKAYEITRLNLPLDS